MASISPNTTGSGAQLAGIQASVPQPVPGVHFSVAPTFEATLGGANGGIVSPLATAPPLAGSSAASAASSVAGGPAVIGGGGTAPAAGAQPAAPGTTVATAGSAVAPTATTTTPPASGTVAASTTAALPTDPAGSRLAQAVSGFGKAERAQPMKVSVDGAEFGFPSFNASAKATAAPGISWGPGWKRVDVNGMWYMQHSNGAKAIPAVEFRVTPSPAEKVSTVKVANGWGKKFPDGTIVVFDRTEGAYRLDAAGAKHKVPLGTHTFGGVKVRLFEASVVRTLEKSGAVTVFDSRGSSGAGSTRGMAAALGTANAGASISGGGGKGGATDGSGGKAVTASGPTSVPSKPGTTVSASGAKPTTGQLTTDVQRLTAIARGLLDQVRSGTVDAAGLASLQAQLGALPAGILQAAGAAGTISSDGRVLRHAGEAHSTPRPAAATPASAGTMPPAVATTIAPTANTSPGALTANVGAPAAVGTPAASATGGGGAPVAGNDANGALKQAAAGTKAKLGIAVPADMVGKQARFAQLPTEVQEAVATALGSTEGAAALKADQLVAFSANGEVSLAAAGTIYTRHVKQVRGAGPGEDLAVTVRPTRQPGSTGSVGSVVTGGSTSGAGAGASSSHAGMAMQPVSGGGTGATVHASTGAPSAGRPTATTPSGAVVALSGPGNTPTRISLFASGASIRSVDLGGVNGSFTWATLPAKAKAAITDYLQTQTSDPAAKAYATRTGSGWAFDPNAVIVVDAGFASFVAGMSMTRAASTTGGGAPAAPGSGTGSVAGGNGAGRPPVSGGGGTGTRPPAAAPPVPLIADPVEHRGAHAAGMPGMRM